MNIVVFASHGGSNLQAVIDAVKEGRVEACVKAVISNNSGAFALERARREGIPAYHISLKTEGSEEAVSQKLLDVLAEKETDLVLLLGYMRMLPVEVLRRYHHRVFNIHPALLPRHGGKGMYGIRVHEAVIAAGDAVSAGELLGEILDPCSCQTLEQLKAGCSGRVFFSHRSQLINGHEVAFRILPETIAG